MKQLQNRKPHAITDLASRIPKAMKIERLLGLSQYHAPLQMLEIGCGSGGISHYFATHATLQCTVTAVDVVDSRQILEGYNYISVAEVTLPFAAEQFDVIISNHVIEHVGDAVCQMQHLSEIYRTLKPEGVAYLAVPNRWALTEPHYKLLFLSWLPRQLRSSYLHLMGKGDFYDCEPLSLSQIESMFSEIGFSYQNLCIEACRETFAIERANHWMTVLLGYVPDRLLNYFKCLIPTLVFRLDKIR